MPDTQKAEIITYLKQTEPLYFVNLDQQHPVVKSSFKNSGGLIRALQRRKMAYSWLSRQKIHLNQLLYAQRLLIDLVRFTPPQFLATKIILPQAKISVGIYPWLDEAETVLFASQLLERLPASYLAAYAEIQAEIERHIPFNYEQTYYAEALPRLLPGQRSAARPHSKKLISNLTRYEDEALLETTYETLTVLQPDGTVLLNRLGETHMVELVGREMQAYSNTVITHTHPKATSFSFADIRFCLQLDLQEIRVACLNNEHKTIYRLVRSEGGWPQWYTVLPVALATLGRVQEQSQLEVAAGQLSAEQAFYQQPHQVWTEVGRLHNLNYSQQILD